MLKEIVTQFVLRHMHLGKACDGRGCTPPRLASLGSRLMGRKPACQLETPESVKIPERERRRETLNQDFLKFF